MSTISEPSTGSVEPERKSTTEQVVSIRHWTPTLLSFCTTRNPDFHFKPGHYARLGLGDGEDRVWRAYSMVSAAHDDTLEFVAVLIPGGAFSERLTRLQVGDPIHVDKLSFGFLTVDQLAPGRDLWLFSSGTGLGPFVSILRDPPVWEAFEKLIVVHSVRRAAELTYRDEMAALPHALSSATARLCYIPIVTREPGSSEFSQRIPQLISDGRLERAAGTSLSLAESRVMVCGNPEMARELRQLLSARGFATTRRGVLGQMAFEKYW